MPRHLSAQPEISPYERIVKYLLVNGVVVGVISVLYKAFPSAGRKQFVRVVKAAKRRAV